MPRITVSYRRDDSAAITGRIFDRLVAHYGRDAVYMDVEVIPFGVDYRVHIDSVLKTSDFLLVIIGPRWAGSREEGGSRIQDATDPVRIEIEAAFRNGRTVLPVLVEGAKMPSPAQLPSTLADFPFINAAEVASGREFEHQISRVISYLDEAARQGAEEGAVRQLAAAAPVMQEQVGSGVVAGALTVHPAKPPGSRQMNNLPTQVTSFIGREREAAQVKELLRTSRLLTLTGVGGSGKSRLSLQAAAELLDQYPEGVWFVEFAPLAQPELVPQTLAGALGVLAEPGQPILSTLLAMLGPKRVLVVLDNCEHLVDACARLADALIHGCPKLSILASSREALQITGETTLRVPPLASADPNNLPPLEELANYEAVRLFVDRASAAQPAFTLTQQNALAAVQICHQLDGIPLAIELAAARVRVLSPEQIATRLDDRFKLLTGGSRTALPRQQTLRALVDWSYDLLNDAEKSLLRRLAIFAGGWTLEAAEAVCAGDSIEGDEVLDLLTSLVEKSLVLAEDQEHHVRYRLLETLRQYGREKLTPDEEAMTAWRHASYCLDFLDGCDSWEYFSRRIDDLPRLDIEYENFRAAMAWAAGAPSPQERSLGACIALNLAYLWYVRGEYDEGLGWLDSARCGVTTGVEGHGFNVWGVTFPATGEYMRIGGFLWSSSIAWGHADYRAAEAFLMEAMKLPAMAQYDALDGLANLFQSLIAVRTGDLDAIPVLLEQAQRVLGRTAAGGIVAQSWGHYALAKGRIEEALDFYDQSVKIFREVGNQRFMAVGLAYLGRAHMSAGHQDRAKTLLRESLPIFRKIGEKRHEADVLGLLGIVVLRQGDPLDATSQLVESLRLRANIGDRRGICESLEAFATVAMVKPADPARAARLLAAATTLRQVIGAPLGSGERALNDELIASVRSQLSSSVFEECWSAGTSLRLEEGLALAFAATTHPALSPES